MKPHYLSLVLSFLALNVYAEIQNQPISSTVNAKLNFKTLQEIGAEFYLTESKSYQVVEATISDCDKKNGTCDITGVATLEPAYTHEGHKESFLMVTQLMHEIPDHRFGYTVLCYRRVKNKILNAVSPSTYCTIEATQLKI